MTKEEHLAYFIRRFMPVEKIGFPEAFIMNRLERYYQRTLVSIDIVRWVAHELRNRYYKPQETTK